MRIGIIGAGQLGRMLALAGYPLGSRFHFLDHSADAPGAQVGEIVLGAFDDPVQLGVLADQVDLMTFDVENVPAPVLRDIARRVRFLPPIDALATAQDRVDEKTMFGELNIPTPLWRAVDSFESLCRAVDDLDLPAVLKTRRLGYDGRGQCLLRDTGDLQPAWDRLGAVPLILEQFQAFDYEVSIIGARSHSGEFVCYPLTENFHVDGILRHCKAPVTSPALESQARAYLRSVMHRFDYEGVLTIEFFVVNGQLMANEIAPRVHNSGHWTIEGAATSQFENHIRAIRGLPLGDTSATGYSAMINFLGALPPLDSVLEVRGAHYHDYGKSPRPMRKVGHCTINTTLPDTRDAALKQLLTIVEQQTPPV